MKRRNILLLDIDGVLNSVESDVAYNGGALSTVSVNLLERVCEAADAAVVMPSSWRGRQSIEEMKIFLREGGASRLAARLIGRTPQPEEMDNSKMTCRRGAEIASWLQAQAKEVDTYLIVDGHADLQADQLTNFVQTGVTYGFGLPEFVLSLRILAPKHAEAERAIRPRHSPSGRSSSDSRSIRPER